MMTDSLGFIEDLIAAMPTPQARMQLVARLAKYQGLTIYIPKESEAKRRARAAQHMLANGMAPTETAHAIHERFRVTMRTAFRDVKAARQLS